MHSALDKVFLNGLTLPFRPFYRRYPFRSPASIRSADDRGMVDMELGFFCNRVPKAANSTVVTNLARLKFGRESSFADFLRKAKAQPRFLYSNAHWAPQSSLMLIPVSQFDLIGKAETLDNDLVEIKCRIRPDLEQPVTSFKRNATGAGDKLRRYYDDELIALVQELYQEDFTTFGYSTEFPA